MVISVEINDESINDAILEQSNPLANATTNEHENNSVNQALSTPLNQEIPMGHASVDMQPDPAQYPPNGVA